MTPGWVRELVRSDRDVHDAGGGMLSALGSQDHGAPYDRRAAIYDRLIGSRFYNRLIWSASTASYASFAEAAVADSDGPLLDIGCGTAVFTAASYRGTERRLVLVDRSLGMLGRAAQRLDVDPDRVAFVQADLFDLPFRQDAFSTVACHGLLHLFDDVGDVLGVLGSQLGSHGTLYATSLTAETVVGSRMLRLLHRAGEAAAPRTAGELAALARDELGSAVRLRSEGCMSYLQLPVG